MALGLCYDGSSSQPTPLDEDDVVAPEPGMAYMLAHFINASDWPRGAGAGRAANTEVQDDGTVVVAGRGVQPGEELLFPYRREYYALGPGSLDQVQL